ncbi:MAG: hypothetical protein ACFE9S_17830, partial [Candidatus Hermodarchaeota archaeon]
MPSRKKEPRRQNISKYFKIFTKIVFYPILITIIIIFIFNQILGICLAGFFFLVYFLSYIITISSKRILITS